MPKRPQSLCCMSRLLQCKVRVPVMGAHKRGDKIARMCVYTINIYVKEVERVFSATTGAYRDIIAATNKKKSVYLQTCTFHFSVTLVRSSWRVGACKSMRSFVAAAAAHLLFFPGGFVRQSRDRCWFADEPLQLRGSLDNNHNYLYS